MAWVIGIAVFLGTMVTVLFLFFALTDRTGQAGKEKRMEKRVPATGNLELSSFGEPSISCKALAENASRHGVRVIVGKPWQPNRGVLVRLPGWDRPSPARIAYCKTVPGESVCALGLQIISDTGGLREFVVRQLHFSELAERQAEARKTKSRDAGRSREDEIARDRLIRNTPGTARVTTARP